jgi:hypothetical protein
MEDKRKNNGGNKNAGRKPKAEEQQLVEKLSPMDKVALDVLKQNMVDGEKWAIELFFKYRYGMPKQVIDQKTELSFPKIDMNEWK